MVAVHVDEASQSTIIQFGVAEHGPLYVTIPEVLCPEDLALRTIRELLSRLGPFGNIVDPVVIINGSHQGLNYSEVFLNARVLRAPSGNTSRLARNMQESAKRDQLSADNTAILNATPASRDEHVRVFKEDPAARSWSAWGDEARQWDEAVVQNRFDPSREASQEALVNALSESKNVIVIVAHCDGETIFMLKPPPKMALS